MIDSQEFIVKGMQRDLSVSKFNPEFAFENMNIRITAREDNTLLSITNEKGNKASAISLTPNKITRTIQAFYDEEGEVKYGIQFKSEHPLDAPITLKSFTIEGYEGQGSLIPDEEIVLTNEDLENKTKFMVASFSLSHIFKGFNVISQSPTRYICYYSNQLYEQPIPEVDDVPLVLIGECIGKEVINDYLVLFTVSEDDPDGKNSRIYRLDYNGVSFTSNLLYHGNLGFDKSHPIESIGVFENETLQKVYWTDGLNPARFINIVADEDKWSSSAADIKWNDSSFDFVSELALKEEVGIEKVKTSSGMFPSGTVQYAFTYYNLYGQQSNIFYVSPLYYNSYPDRGGSPEDKVGVSYKITVLSPDINFQYIRIYSILRTSIDATPVVKRVTDLQVDRTQLKVSFIDSNITGDTVDPTELLYMGGEEAVFGCMCQKDNTLFLGNIKLVRSIIPKDDADRFKMVSMNQSTKGLLNSDSTLYNGYYSYLNQLGNSSHVVTTFKNGETYRFGVQFQHKSGRWSEVVPLGDYKINKAPERELYQEKYPTSTTLVSAPSFKFNAQSLSPQLSALVKNGYVKARGVVVYPDASERTVICQGFVCPTVYNVNDRVSNYPYAQSSWFLRPNIKPGDDVSGYILQTNHNNALFPTDEQGSEIQTMAKPFNEKNNAYEPLESPFVTDDERNEFIGKYSDFFYVDRGICTLHSPDIEFDKGLQISNLSGVKFRIVGAANVRAVDWDVDITMKTPPRNESLGGFLTFKDPRLNVGGVAAKFRPIASYVLYFDAHDRSDEETLGDRDGGMAAYPVYVWQRDGSLANAKDNRYARLDKKKFSQLVYCSSPDYLSTSKDFSIADVQIFNSNEVTPLKLNYSGSPDSIFYYGNVDKLIISPRVEGRRKGYSLTVAGWTDVIFKGSTNTGYVDAARAATAPDREWIYIQQLAKGDYDPWPPEPDNIEGHEDGKYPKPSAQSAVYYAVDPVRMKYKSTPHAVFTLGKFSDGQQYIIPQNTSKDTQFSVTNTGAFWDSRMKGYYAPSVYPNTATTRGVNVWIGEFYRDSTPTFGGESEEAYASNRWIPAGEAVTIVSEVTGKPMDFTIVMSQGDTFYQRYDCLKTYPFTMEDQNSLVEIVSVMLETKVNIDGRYDNNRGYPGLALSPTNFNLLNDIYSQKDNFFPQQYISKQRGKVDLFPSSITWTKTKTLSEEVDTWTNITLASTLDLDGDKGELRSMKLFNNEIIAFQDNAISNILFNSRVQMNASDGIPIEIANSGKVDGKRYISNHIGTVNKFGIVETPLGLYFMDNNSTSIYQYNGQLNDISDNLGFRAWCSDHIKPDDFGKPLDQIFTGHYDRSNSDLYFNNPQYSLGFSSLLNQFTSFYSYENIPFMFNVRDKFFSLRLQGGNTEVWEQNAGDYNYYYGEFKPFYTHIIANKDMTKDKIFNTLEFRADSYDGENLLNYDTFDRLDVWNEYQRGSLNLLDRINHPSSLKKKFRVWKANFPREAGKPLNRIRNTWVNVKLGKYTPNKLRTVLHDMTVHYTV